MNIKSFVVLFFLSLSSYSQLHVNLKDLIDYQTMKIGEIEESLVFQDWTFSDVHDRDFLGSNVFGTDYVFTQMDFYGNKSGTIVINIREEERKNGVTYRTTENNNYKWILTDLTAHGYQLTETGSGILTLPDEKKEVGDQLVKSSMSKIFSNGSTEIEVYSTNYREVISINPYFGTYETIDLPTEYQVSIR